MSTAPTLVIERKAPSAIGEVTDETRELMNGNSPA
jgi:hypothetical protein